MGGDSLAALGVPMECASCGTRWEVLPKGDGTMPRGARCPVDRGGCGKVRKLPRLPAVPAILAAAGAWNPPSESRVQRRAAEPCPECGGPVVIEPRGITRWCPACPLLITPPGVLAPYERGPGTIRESRSQRERDDDAKKTALLAGEFLRRVRALLADPKIHPASADLLGWYEEEITEARRARNGPRLAELAAEFADDQAAGAFRRLRWWHGQAAPVTAGYDEQDGEDDPIDDGGEAPAAAPAIAPGAIARQQPARPPRATWADAFGARGWRLAETDGSGACQVAERNGRCTRPTGGHPPVTDGLATGWTCTGHYLALGVAISAINRERGFP